MTSNFKFQISNFVAKLRGLPDVQKKFIFIFVMIIFSLLMAIWGIKSTQNNVAKIKSSVGSMDFPSSDTLLQETNSFESTIGAPDMMSDEDFMNDFGGMSDEEDFYLDFEEDFSQ